MRSKSTLNRNVWVILAAATILRIGASAVAYDFSNEYYWEYSELAKNLLAGRGYSLFSAGGELLDHRFDPADTALPSAYMPPGYVLFIVPFLAIGNAGLTNVLLVLVQTVLALFTILLVYMYTRSVFSERAALAAMFIAAIAPEMVYAVLSTTPTVLFQLGIMLVFYLTRHPEWHVSGRTWTLVTLISVVLAYLRFDVLLFVVAMIAIHIHGRSWRKPALALAAVALLLLPWLARNYQIFDNAIVLSTSQGLNLYRGHNDVGIGTWGNEHVAEALAKLPRDERFELAMDSLFRHEALGHLVSHWDVDFIASISKVFYLWSFNPLQERSGYVVVGVSMVLVVVLAMIGTFRNLEWSAVRIPVLFLIASTIVGVAFFALPRHQTMMKIALLPFAGRGIESLLMMLSLRRNRQG